MHGIIIVNDVACPGFLKALSRICRDNKETIKCDTNGPLDV